MSSFDRPPILIVGLYVLLVFLVPYAKTSEERAAAQSASASVPYKVQRAVERIKARLGVKEQPAGLGATDRQEAEGRRP
jgi:hypothetical protein